MSPIYVLNKFLMERFVFLSIMICVHLELSKVVKNSKKKNQLEIHVRANSLKMNYY
jgi:hypothetical protein